MGGTCAMCPRLTEFPHRCAEPEPISWRDDAPEVQGECCPVLLATECQDVVLAHRFFTKNFALPFPGGWAQQHAALIEALEIVSTQQARVEHERAVRDAAQGER